MKFKALFSTTVIAALTAPAFGGDLYGLGSIGGTQTHLGQSTFDGQLGNAGATGLNSTLEDGDFGWKLQLGYQFNPNFALEGGYVDLGKIHYNASYDQGNATGDYKAGGFNVAGLGILPLNEKFSVFGKLGFIDARVTSNLGTTGLGGAASSFGSTQWRPNYGIGGMYNVSKSTSVRVELERFDGIGDESTSGRANIDFLSVGLSHKF